MPQIKRYDTPQYWQRGVLLTAETATWAATNHTLNNIWNKKEAKPNAAVTTAFAPPRLSRAVQLASPTTSATSSHCQVLCTQARHCRHLSVSSLATSRHPYHNRSASPSRCEAVGLEMYN